MLQRMIRAARLDVHLYEEVESDPKATVQALLIVVLVAIAGGIGSALVASTSTSTTDSVGLGFIGGLIIALVGWVVWAGATFLVGTTILKTPGTKATWGELARTTGFAQSPGVLNVFAFIPVLGPILSLVVLIWRLVAMVIAVRQALDFTSTLRTVGVVLIAAIPYIIVIVVVYAIMGGGSTAA